MLESQLWQNCMAGTAAGFWAGQGEEKRTDALHTLLLAGVPFPSPLLLLLQPFVPPMQFWESGSALSQIRNVKKGGKIQKPPLNWFFRVLLPSLNHLLLFISQSFQVAAFCVLSRVFRRGCKSISPSWGGIKKQKQCFLKLLFDLPIIKYTLQKVWKIQN